MIQQEVESQMRPLQTALSQIQNLVSVTDRLSPLASLLSGVAPRRGPGRPPGSGNLALKGKAGRSGPASAQACAIIGCKRPSRTKGFCAAHYQKLRTLTRTNRRPSAWVDFAPPSSVADIVLPRGRAAHKNRRLEA